MAINHVCISGNATKNAELRRTPAGMAVCNFTLAVNDRRKNPQTQQWEDYANFIDCTLFGARAEALQPLIVKGMKCCVEGRLHYSSWTDKASQQMRSKIDVTVNEIEILPRPKAEQPAPEQMQYNYQ